MFGRRQHVTAVKHCACSLLLTVMAAFQKGSKHTQRCQEAVNTSLPSYWPSTAPSWRDEACSITASDWTVFSRLKEMLLGAIKATVCFVTSMHTDLLLNQAEIRLEIPSSFLFLSSAVQWFGVTLKSTPVKSRLRLTASVLYRHLFSFRSTGSLRRVDPACLSSSITLRRRPGVCFDHTHKWNIVTSAAPLFFVIIPW